MPAFSRRDFIRTVAGGSAGLVLGARLAAQPAKLPLKPNLIVFLPDELRADTIVGKNASSVRAPNLHKLASQSVGFDRAYVTHPICSPSRSSILTGTWPHQNGCTKNKLALPREFRCLPEMLADSDYRTGYFGKWHLGDEFSAQHGFQEWISTEDEYLKSAGGGKIEGVSDYAKFLSSKGYKPDRDNKYFSYEFVCNLPVELRKPKFLESKACQFLEAHRNDPFVLFVAYFEPHPPYCGPLKAEYSPDALSLDPTVEATFGEDVPLRYRLLQEFYRKIVGLPEAYRETEQNYFGLITEVDRSVGAILAKLDDLGLTDRTITVLTSDHGDMMSAHGLLGKMVMFDQSARVPYFVRMPGQTRALNCPNPISHIDFAPTMLDLLGKRPDARCAGESRANLIRGESAPPGPVFLEWSPGDQITYKPKLFGKREVIKLVYKNTKLGTTEEIKRCITESTRTVVSQDGWKLSLRDKDKNELYNLRDDPDERTNLYYKNVRPEIISRLTGEIHKWQENTGDSLKV
jgi:arylsulfatase A-like enzyme